MAVTKTYVIRIPDDIRKVLEAFAEERGMLLSQVIRLALKDYIKREKEKRGEV